LGVALRRAQRGLELAGDGAGSDVVDASPLEPALERTEPVIVEVLAGARSESREADLRRMLLGFELLRFDIAADFDAAARIYRRCRRAGVTPRGLVDCLIASVAHRHGASLLAHDRDIAAVARVMDIPLDTATV
jgi:predicted nucleic acid-binding protein